MFVPGLQVPHVSRQEFTLLDITEDGFVSASPFHASMGCVSSATSESY